MEAQTAQPPAAAAAAAAYPRWVMLEQDLKIQAKGSSCYTSGACKTLAVARTSAGHLIQVSLRLAEPPAVSCVCLETSDVVVDAKYSTVVAAHGDSVLIEIVTKVKNSYMLEQFLYSAGDAAADPPQPPSLRLLPLLPPGSAGSNGTGIVRRGEDELVVAQLKTVPVGPQDAPPELMTEADLYLFRYGEWSVKRLQITSRDGSEVCAWVHPLAKLWNAVFPVGDGGLLCWVDLGRLVVLLCDVFEETPRLQLLPLPKDNILGPTWNRNVCATAGGAALKFVNIFPRCCCGDSVVSSFCERSRHAYTIHTWTMRIADDDANTMEWVMDGVVDATELWALDAYNGLRCLPLDHPVVSMDEPELIYFWMHQHSDKYYRDRTVELDLLMVNMTSKTIHSVDISRYENGLLLNQDGPIPSNISYFFNSYRPCSRSDGILTGQHKDIERPPPATVDAAEELTTDDDHASNPALQPAASSGEPYVQASEIFKAFQEIPSFGLYQDEIVKAYSILSRDNGRRFRSFIWLPKNVRKDWLLMEIKACED